MVLFPDCEYQPYHHKSLCVGAIYKNKLHIYQADFLEEILAMNEDSLEGLYVLVQEEGKIIKVDCNCIIRYPFVTYMVFSKEGPAVKLAIENPDTLLFRIPIHYN